MKPMKEKVWDLVQDHMSNGVYDPAGRTWVESRLARRIYNPTVVRIVIAVRSLVYRSLLPKRP
jgi:hypothetical protein